MTDTESSQQYHILWISLYTIRSNDNSECWIALGWYIIFKYIRRGIHLTNEVLSMLRRNVCSNLLMHKVNTNVPFCIQFPMELLLLQNPSSCTTIWLFSRQLKTIYGIKHRVPGVWLLLLPMYFNCCIFQENPKLYNPFQGPAHLHIQERRFFRGTDLKHILPFSLGGGGCPYFLVELEVIISHCFIHSFMEGTQLTFNIMHTLFALK